MYFKLTIIAMVISFSAIGFAADNYSVERQAMLEEIKSDTKLTSFATGKTELSTPVINALLSVPRHKFVRPRDRNHAYENRPLRIGHGQTISQPYIVALMTDLLNLKKK
jgi:protein-L-isoaspartate(D-aspartate) O-methyltransferase